MATSDDIKKYLDDFTGVPSQHWKRISKSKNESGVVRVFENKLNQTVITVLENHAGELSVVAPTVSPPITNPSKRVLQQFSDNDLTLARQVLDDEMAGNPRSVPLPTPNPLPGLFQCTVLLNAYGAEDLDVSEITFGSPLGEMLFGIQVAYRGEPVQVSDFSESILLSALPSWLELSDVEGMLVAKEYLKMPLSDALGELHQAGLLILPDMFNHFYDNESAPIIKQWVDANTEGTTNSIEML